jgi:hypothetical protein
MKPPGSDCVEPIDSWSESDAGTRRQEITRNHGKSIDQFEATQTTRRYKLNFGTRHKFSSYPTILAQEFVTMAQSDLECNCATWSQVELEPYYLTASLESDAPDFE